MIKENLQKIKESISKEVSLVAVSKTKPIADAEAKIEDLAYKIEELTASSARH